MEKIYSKVDKNKLLHIVFRSADFIDGRLDIVPDLNFIQCSSLQLKKDHTFKPHYHIYKKVDEILPQESWVVLSGKVKCIFYDIDNQIIAEPILEPGDVSFTLHGAHNYLLLEDSRILEFKVGPYLGVEQDKIRL